MVLVHSPILAPLCTVSPSPPPTPVSYPTLNTLKRGSVCLITDPSLRMKLLCTPLASSSRERMAAMDVGLQLAEMLLGLLPGPDQGPFPQVIIRRTGYFIHKRGRFLVITLRTLFSHV